MITDLAGLSAVERQRLVDDFVAEAFGNVEDASGIGNRMREATSSLPDDPSIEQLNAWVEVGKLVQDPEFRERVKLMAEAGARNAGNFDAEEGKALAARIAEHATAAVEAGIDPASNKATAVLDRIVQGSPAERAAVAEQLETFTDGRVDRYWHLVGVINGWPPFTSAFSSYEWVIEAIKARSG